MATPTNLPAAFVSGAILTADQMNNLRGAFRVLQVVSGTYSNLITNNTNTFADTGLSATITPQATTSKILVIVSQTFGKTNGNANNAVQAKIVRNATDVQQFMVAGLYSGSILDVVGPSCSAVALDSPATTSATTYKTQFANFTNAAGVTANTNTAVATIILMEISA